MGTGGGLVVIDFSELGNSANFRRGGWSGQEPDRVWAVGCHSELRIPIQAAARPIVLDVEIDPCREPPMAAGQIVRVRIDGTVIGGVRIERRSMIRCEVDPAILRHDGMIDLQFEFPGFFRPRAFGISEDDRPLSGSFSFVRAYTIDMFKPGPHFPASRADIPVVGLVPPFPAGPAIADRIEPAIYRFGLNGSAMPFMRGGWAHGEDNLGWIIAAAAQIELPAPARPGPYVLRLDATPADASGAAPPREITILLDRIVVGQFSLDEPTTWSVPLPRELTEGRDTLPLTFVPRDAGRRERASDPPLPTIALSELRIVPLPSRLAALEHARIDHPLQAVTVSHADVAAPDVDPLTLARGFESLGADRAFGMVQREFGLDVVNLFRFCNVAPADLARALADDLRALADPAALMVALNDADPREYMVTCPAYHMAWHTFRYEHDADADTVWSDHAARLDYPRRKFFEGLREGRKIYVVKQPRPIALGWALALLMELNRHGDATLLCVEPAAAKQQPGDVEWLMPGLLRGYLGPLDTDPAVWLRLMANAAMPRRGQAVNEVR